MESGYTIISFIEMGGHRFELCLAQEMLPEAQSGYPRIGFTVTEENLQKLMKELDEADIAYEGPRGLVRMRDNHLAQSIYLAQAEGLQFDVLAELVPVG